MARIPFQKPKTIEWQILSDRHGRLVAEPFEKGYALTVGNSLRRTLLSIIPGAAVTWVRVKGVKDVETRLPGVAESTQDVLLNLKKLAVNVPSGESMETRLEAKGPKAVTGADVSEATGVEVLNQPFIAKNTIATAGGCLASPYLAAWILARLEGIEAAESALHYVAPVGEKDEYVERAMGNITPYLTDAFVSV